MTDTPVVLEMRSITKTFPGVRALDQVRMSVRAGEIHAICGENGAGKSTLMKILSGVYPYGTYQGQIVYQGEEVRFKDIKSSERAGIVIIHQELALIPELSIAENIFLGNENSGPFGIDWDTTRERAAELLARVGLDTSPDELVKNIGVGQAQLVEIARALSKDVKLLILDEPTSALNEEDSEHLLDLLRGLRAKGLTSIMISHKLNEIAAIADSITIIRDGRTVETLDAAAGEVDEDRIIRGMVGRSLDHRFPEHTPQIGEVFFEVRDWTVEHPQVADRLVCKGSTFHVRHGEIVGFAGIMGAGRTELARSIFGRSYGRWRGGQILIDGKPVELTTVQQAIDHGIAYVPEDRKIQGLNLLDSILDTIVSADLKRITKHRVLDTDLATIASEHYRTSLNIKTPSVREGVVKLSGGNQQKVLLGKWMFPEPGLLILDEPTRGVDVGAKYEIYGLVQRLADEGKGVVVISSELPELLGLCDRIYTIFEGRITGVLDREQANQEDLMRLMTGSSPAVTH
ncbi:multiple monosaccharide ABC transporter ATP-binding protein [Cellulomonas denverensis]|uniref:Sugar ABC transporter ATP-binding protein n=1 Tax=Cellulomonas denverensis TaxID=264297 RepID=A0A7X6KVJ8_9CELL|nr:multiple monosaccharide ABC transporter ATP-binding protein [Cellulomonas denverensis]NKY23101.1 sugar ABC transporter ATP-binding protein [Cellulomonas denverensis]GIG23818.1 xylose ABC transporter ATP-binding protein [Cellulomonas denverensis]